MTVAEFAWRPSEQQVRDSRLYNFMRTLQCSDMETLYATARMHPEDFWSAAIQDIGIEWSTTPRVVFDMSGGIEWTQWWVGAGFNFTTNAVDRHVHGKPNDVALIWEGDDGDSVRWTWQQLAMETSRAAYALRQLGVHIGDTVGLCMPMLPETVGLFLACARIGAIVCPLFSGYGASAISTRLHDCDAKVLCIANAFKRRGTVIPMLPIAREVVATLPELQHLLVVRRVEDDSLLRPGSEHWYHELCAAAPSDVAAEATGANDPFMLIYTSGTTGKPKGTVHVHGGFPIKATQDMAHCFDVRATDRFLWYTDIGWMMGPWVICGTLILGATLVLFEGVPDYPRPNRLWDVVQRHDVTVLGVAPTVIRALIAHGTDPVRSHDLSGVRVLGSSGEPWNTDPWLWFLREVGGNRCPIINYSGGTEIGGGIVSANMITPLMPCAFAGPVPGMDADVVDDGGYSVRDSVGELVVRRPWPGMTQGFWHDPQRYLQTYWNRWPHVWAHGDWAEIDDNGLWYIRGRSDDTLKIAGKRVGPAEVESILVAHPAVLEAAAIGIPDEIKGEALVAFVVLGADAVHTATLPEELCQHVALHLGKALRPHTVIPVPEIPKTRNAKVLRRVIRSVYLGQDPGDLSALDNHTAIDAIAQAR